MKKMKKKASSDEDEVGAASKPTRSGSMERKMKKVERDIQNINKKTAKRLESGKRFAAKVEAERAESLMPLEKTIEKLLDQEAEKFTIELAYLLTINHEMENGTLIKNHLWKKQQAISSKHLVLYSQDYSQDQTRTYTVLTQNQKREKQHM